MMDKVLIYVAKYIEFIQNRKFNLQASIANLIAFALPFCVISCNDEKFKVYKIYFLGNTSFYKKSKKKKGFFEVLKGGNEKGNYGIKKYFVNTTRISQNQILLSVFKTIVLCSSLILAITSCIMTNGEEVNPKSDYVRAKIDGVQYSATVIFKDNKSEPDEFGFASTDERDTSIEITLPKFEVQSGFWYVQTSTQPPNGLSIPLSIHFKQPDKIGHYIKNFRIKFLEVSIDKKYVGEFEFVDNYYSTEVVVTNGQFSITP